MSAATTAATAAIFLLTYLVVAIGRAPGLRIDRAGAALVGGSLMVAVGAVPLDSLAKAIDMPTLALLLGLMIVIGNLRLSGFFRLVNARVVARAHHPLQLLAAVILSAGVLSAFLLNDAICLVMTPLVIDIARRLRRNPVPYLLAVAIASNIGSTATITGNPQNILIGSYSGISYVRFAAALSPIALAGLVLTFLLIWLMHPDEFRRDGGFDSHPAPAHLHAPLAVKAILVSLAMVAAFFAGVAPAVAALVAGGAMLVTRIVRSERIYHEIDLPLLLMFSGLFVVVAGFENALIGPEVVSYFVMLHLDRVPMLSLVTAGLSNLLSNVPAVLALRPFIRAAAGPHRTWLTVAMASTLAGNLTIIGSVANLIVVQGARAKGVAISFWSYFRVGAPVTVLTIALGAYWLSR